ncbi:hypothetical protein WMY93_008335 [Mugilogobius chulae]|uniref:Uncharacterized protein n=1 Tax=Mugilogobius chulae TaxID=88201 RepID=A0AAW0PPJ9_9GOBI
MVQAWLRALTIGLNKNQPSQFAIYQRPIKHTHERPQAPPASSIKSITPALPPRTQFVNQIPLDRSYENLADGSDYENPDEDAVHDYEEADSRSLPEYLKLESGPAPRCYPEEQEDEDYDDITTEEKQEEDEDYDDVG